MNNMNEWQFTPIHVCERTFFIIITHINKDTTINYLHIGNKFITYKKLGSFLYLEAVLSQYNH